MSKETVRPASLSRRDACKGLGLLGLALVLGGCDGFRGRGPLEPLGLTILKPAPLTPEQFEARAGKVEDARAMTARGSESLDEFMEDFLLLSPRIQAACEPGGLIGSVFYNPRPASIASAVKFQLARERWEPALLHNDLGRMAATQYKRTGYKTFAAIYPSSVSLIGDSIHKDRSLLQLVIGGRLPSEKIVCTNQDLESLIGRQLTLADQIVHGIRCGNDRTPLQSNNIREDTRRIAEGTSSLSLARALASLEVAGAEVRMITPADPHEQPGGWQHVSDVYRNFAVGQFIEAQQMVAEYIPRNAFEKDIQSNALAEYQPYLSEIMRRLDWGHTCHQTYQGQKQDARVDLLTQLVLPSSEEPSAPRAATEIVPVLKS